MQQAKIKNALNTYQKYYVTLDIKTVLNTIGCK